MDHNTHLPTNDQADEAIQARANDLALEIDNFVFDSINQQANTQPVDETVRNRVSDWAQAVDARTLELMQQAAAMLESRNTAKTNTKREYYNKKVRRIRDELMSMEIVRERLTGKHE